MYDFETGVARCRRLFSTVPGRKIGIPYDYVPSLVSVYPDLATMKEDAKKMKVQFWFGVFCEAMGSYCKQPFP